MDSTLGRRIMSDLFARAVSTSIRRSHSESYYERIDRPSARDVLKMIRDNGPVDDSARSLSNGAQIHSLATGNLD